MLAIYAKKICLFVPLKLFSLLIYSHVKVVKGYTDINVYISTLGKANTKVLFFLEKDHPSFIWPLPMSFNSFTGIPSFKTNKQQINKKMPDIKMLEPCSDIRYLTGTWPAYEIFKRDRNWLQEQHFWNTICLFICVNKKYEVLFCCCCYLFFFFS